MATRGSRRAEPAPQPRRSEPRERLLATASELFYAEGIGNVGVNRIVSASKVTLATFYRHFPGKEDLVVSYLEGIHARIAERADELAAAVSGRELVAALRDEVVAEIGRPNFRGCAFINAASEFEDPTSPVRVAIAEHRRWYYELVRRAFSDAGHPTAASPARNFLMLRDGAVVAAYLDSATAAQRTFRRGVDGLLWSIGIETLPGVDDA
ncbi:TetR/AcrR family transcriptional regulator [Aquihabitans sp. G128]|uniref:TetR/AcrR family transcriptional regulator n=1 Tax=Aquihabitans sp. G128 TaxID=2849779 RepID=UPI001C235BE6|nr:TetR/AcrR family transcriptional regulator [Aquihabitans sp. G128]QXC60686.1 TetR/AcrR family transcriptional regulator [Aquihabitans sp. G128]